MRRLLTVLTALLLAVVFASASALALDKPEIALDKVEIASIQPFFVKPRIGYKSEKEPGTVGKYGYSATMNVAYVLKITNPNPEPVMLDHLQFTIKFEGFEVNTVNVYEDQWIPGGKDNQLRVIATNEAFPTIVSLMVGAENVQRVQDMKTSAGALVSKWWKSIADFSFPIEIVNGTAVFLDEEGNEMRVAFSGKSGQKAEEEPESKE
jgi:hypothetical protein